MALWGCTDPERETDTADERPECATLTDGTWSATGPGFGMSMTATLTFDPASCAFTLTEWSMVHSGPCTGGTVDDDTVTLTGETDYWSTCEGTAESAERVSGVCAETGGAFELSFTSP